ncbi:MAG TPA: dihydrofolate reductase family protein [Brevundimonas sp.]|jgi:dihydrofolate reductase|uniref:dihydrofolate reductase family protein n=1 Tax=Brevundimonas sp. TaxID=1871086 RepID=UPI002DE774E1|nr:dihydrofolate reductase family protein [Brevundimonas sp.]
MRQIRAAVFVSMDGVMQAPGGPEEDPTGGFRFGGWNAPWWDETLEGLMGGAMGSDYDLLLGRRTYEIFSAFWPYQGDEIGRAFDAATKYVAARPGTPLTWVNSERLEGDVPGAVRALKADGDRDLLINGSGTLIRSLLAHDLIDRLTVITFPVILGEGRRLFEHGASPHAWEMETGHVTPKGVIFATYRRAGDVPVGTFETQPPSDAELKRRERWAQGG